VAGRRKTAIAKGEIVLQRQLTDLGAQGFEIDARSS
jgi:hypothetical protein